MRTERTFLMELFLDDELPKKIKLLIKERFQEMEEAPQQSISRAIPMQPVQHMQNQDPGFAQQSPSMQRLMTQNPDLIPRVAAPVTPAAAQALAARNALMQSAANEKPEQGRTAKRKI